MNRRILSVRLPFFPVERFLKDNSGGRHSVTPQPDDRGHPPVHDAAAGPLVLARHGAKGTRISAVGRDAARAGLWVGMKLADARAMMPGLPVAQHDIAADRRAHARLGRWLMRYSPSVALHGENGFLLDTAGCDHLFGGEEAMAGDLIARLGLAGHSARLAFADTVGAALALTSHGADSVHVLPPGHAKRMPSMLDTLPVEALRLDEYSVMLLKRLGLKRIEDVRLLPRAALERRFREHGKTGQGRDTSPAALSRSVQRRLDQLTGAIAEPLATLCEPPRFRAVLPCPEPALATEAVGVALDRLLPELRRILVREGLGARHFRLVAYRADGTISAAAVHLSQPGRDAAMVKRLFRDRLERIDCGHGVDLFALSAGGTAPLSDSQGDMMTSCAPSDLCLSLSAFADVVNTRVDAQAVYKFAPVASHVPERAQRPVPVTRPVDWPEWEKLKPDWAPRPSRLLARPEPCEVIAMLPDSPPAQFVWRRVAHRVVRARGPERILPEWWHDNLKSRPSAIFRDYYDVEDSEGLRYWIFRSLRREPVVAKQPPEVLEDGKDATEPETMIVEHWFVHGLF